MQTIAGYCRVSSDEQARVGTIATQRQEITTYAAREGFQIDWYEDDGYSGVIPLAERPAGKRLLAEIDADRVNHLVIFDFTRLARGKRSNVVLNTVYDLLERGCRVTSIHDHEDLYPSFADDEEAEDINLMIRSWYSASERKRFLLRVRLGKLRAANEGRWWGGPMPYGYASDENKHIVLDQSIAGAGMTKAQVIERIFSMIAGGSTTTKVADHLNALQIPSAFAERKWEGVPRMGKWRHNVLLRILHRDWYYGEHTYRSKKGETVLVKVPPLVTRDVWETVQRVLTSNERKSTRNAKRSYPLRGLIKCSCGRTFSGDLEHGKDRVYRCSSRRDRHLRLCSFPRISAPSIEGIVWRGVLAQLRAYDGYLLPSDVEEDHSEELAACRVRLDNLGKQRKRLVTAFGEGTINADDLAQQLKRMDTEKSSLSARVQELQHVESSRVAAPQIDELQAVVMHYQDDDEIAHEVMAEVFSVLVEYVQLDNDRSQYTATVKTVLGEFQQQHTKKR